ncbi:outer membrane receptor protein involved in Fe transport [Altererythrobacter atlanticus]|uniref:Colicin I receptor n=1 Tax=Croceibacterium atlanticum TaxID=1267766 RepID=A0A0F7KQX4_9SPHN|nr:TonB-dependent receptor [Croceibacterium atlanticum]AKH41501.1 Colicin I receptor precursor [Croceibacterium atlanticum]MBB5732963.1 outer membrane receptor protein involved in Fe transport [Croceibacterium atlanticum]
MNARQITGSRAFFLAGSALAALSALPAHAQDGGSDGGQGAGNEPIVVTGSRLQRTTFDAPSPVTTLGGDDLARRGVTNIAEAITELPSFRDSTGPQTQGFGSFNVGARIVNLRGLGVTRNLILVDGRRFAPSTREGSVDLNFIPSILIDRTEIVTGGASAAYGSDAITGVVNVILDKNLEGLKVQADYGVSEEGDGDRYHAAAAFGTSIGDRGHFVIGGEWSDQNGIGNCFTRDWCTPGAVVTNLFHGTGNGLPNYVRSNDNAGLRFNNAGVVYAGPTDPNGVGSLLGTGGITFDSDGNPQPFEVGNPAFALFQRGGDILPAYINANITVPVERYSVNAFADYEIADDVTVFVEGTYGHVDGQLLQTSFFSLGIPIYADNPFIPAEVRATLPAGQQAQPAGPDTLVRPGAPAFSLARMFDDFGRGYSTSAADTYRASAGIEGKLGSNWNWDGYYQYSRTDRLQRVEDNLVVGAAIYPVSNPATIAQSNAYFYFAADAVVDPSTGQPTCRALLSDDPALVAAAQGCVPVNLFGENNYDPAAKDYIYGTLIEDIKLEQHVLAANLAGDLFDAPGGPVGLAFGAEYRVDKIDVVHDDLSNLYAYFQNFGADYNGKTEVVEGYAEVEVPLLSDQPFAQALTVNGAIRQTHYKVTGFGSYLRTQVENSFDATAWKLSANWEPTDWLRFRVSRSRDIRAPNFAELFLSSASSFTTVANPFNPGQTENPDLRNGGSPFIDPEKADTWGVGMILQPSGFLDGFRLSVDYYDIKVKDYIGTPPGGFQNIINECYGGRQAACDLINDGSIAAGEDITEIRSVSLNLEELRTSGIDFEADYRFELGGENQLLLRGLATYTDELTTVAFGQEIDRAGQTGIAGSISAPKWSANGFLTFVNPRFTATLQGRYIDSGVLDALYSDPSDPGYDPTLPNSINDNSVPSRFYLNLFGTMKIGPDWENGNGFELFFRINNLLDKDPPIVPEFQFPTNPVYFDTIGRYYTFGARARF